MPDSGIMLDLCELLKINVNELLSGERIMAEAYDKRAEENLLAMKSCSSLIRFMASSR